MRKGLIISLLLYSMLAFGCGKKEVKQVNENYISESTELKTEEISEINSAEEITIKPNSPAEELLLALESKEYGAMNSLISKVGDNNETILQNIDYLYDSALGYYEGGNYYDAEKWMRVVETCNHLDSKEYNNALSVIDDLNEEKLSKGQIEDLMSFENKDILPESYRIQMEKIIYQYKALQGYYKSEPNNNGVIFYYYHNGLSGNYGVKDYCYDTVFNMYYFINEDVWRDMANLHIVSAITDKGAMISGNKCYKVSRDEMPAVFNDLIDNQSEKTIEQANKEAAEEYERIENYVPPVKTEPEETETEYEPAIGMTAAEVEKSSWGKPKEINRTTYAWGIKEQWCYIGYNYIYLEDGIVTAISEHVD